MQKFIGMALAILLGGFVFNRSAGTSVYPSTEHYAAVTAALR